MSHNWVTFSTYHAQGVARKSFARASYLGCPSPPGHRVQLSRGRSHVVYVPGASAWHKYLVPCHVGIYGNAKDLGNLRDPCASHAGF